MRPCNAAGTAVEPLAPPTLPLLHRCSCSGDGDGNGRRAHHRSDRQRGNYKVVAATLVHLVVRGRDIGLPRSTLPVRYSFPASLMHYTRLSASACVVVSLLVLFPPPSLSLGVSAASFPSSPLSPPFFSPLFYVSLSTSLSICLPFRLFSLVHLIPAGLSIARWFSLSLSIFAKTPTRRGSQRIRRIVITRSHLSCLAPPRIQAAMARPEVATKRRKRLRTGADGNDRITITIATTMPSPILRRYARLQFLSNYN